LKILSKIYLTNGNNKIKKGKTVHNKRFKIFDINFQSSIQSKIMGKI